MLRVLLAGKHELACRIYELLSARSDIELAVVLCAGERSLAGRDSLTDLTRAGEARILADPESVSLLTPVTDFRPDLLVSAGFDRIIKPQVLSSLPLGLNIHFGLLPRYRGNYSVPLAIINGEDRIGVTLHEIAEGIDDGRIVDQAALENDRSLSCREIYLRCVSAGVGLLDRHLPTLLAGGTLPAVAQDGSRASYYPPEFPGAFKVTWKQAARQVADYVRACHFPPYPGATTVVGGEEMELRWPLAVRYDAPRHPYGLVVRYDGSPWIATLDGLIGPQEIAASGRVMPFADLVAARGLEGTRCA